MSSQVITASWWANSCYVLKTVLSDLSQKKSATLLTILVIATSLTLPTVSYLLWKNINYATTQFYPANELTVYLHKNLSESDALLVVEKIRQQKGVENINYISRQESLNEFKHWAGFNENLEILDENPLPAVVIVKPQKNYNESQKRNELRENIHQIKGVQEVHIDNNTTEKLTALSRLIANIAIICTILMVVSVFLVIGNSIRSDVYSRQNHIEVMKLLGATDQFIFRPFTYIGIIYAVCGGFLACVFSAIIISYLTNIVRYVANIFVITFDLHGIILGELLFLLSMCALIGYIAAWLSVKKYS